MCLYDDGVTVQVFGKPLVAVPLESRYGRRRIPGSGVLVAGSPSRGTEAGGIPPMLVPLHTLNSFHPAGPAYLQGREQNTSVKLINSL